MLFGSRTTVVGLVLTLTACPGLGPAADGGFLEDAGHDAGNSVDAGTADAGFAGDAGAFDAGEAPPDAGGLGDAGRAYDAGIERDFTRTPPLYRSDAAGERRSYDVHVPASYDGRTPLPVVLVLHGGGGNRANALKTTCPNSNASSPECMSPIADAHGFVAVYPDGTGAPLLSNLRTWNAGGGDAGWQCVSGYACNKGIDEKAYFVDLLTDLHEVLNIDLKRVYATGHSNGAALSERLACEMPEYIAAIAPVAGGNQYATIKPCPVGKPVLEFHGTADPCWPFDGGAVSCADTNLGSKIGVRETLEGWAARNGCDAGIVTTALPDTTDDGTAVLRHQYNCPPGHDVELYEVIDGGHTWPGGSQVGDSGLVSTDISANRVMIEFFEAHP